MSLLKKKSVKEKGRGESRVEESKKIGEAGKVMVNEEMEERGHQGSPLVPHGSILPAVRHSFQVKERGKCIESMEPTKKFSLRHQENTSKFLNKECVHELTDFRELCGLLLPSP